jgi:hypothetical protein
LLGINAPSSCNCLSQKLSSGIEEAYDYAKIILKNKKRQVPKEKH